jgi:hypothetical protein
VADWARQALTEQNLKIQSVDEEAGVLTAGPAKYAATSELPSLDATVTVSAQTQGAESKVRIYASSVLAAGEKGASAEKLAALTQNLDVTEMTSLDVSL